MKSITLLTFAAGAMAGSTIKNSCSFPAYAWHIVDDYSPEPIILQPNEMQTIPYQTKKDGGGPSIKISPINNLWGNIPLTQLEYMDGATLWYDLSNINLGDTGVAPFNGHILNLVPSVETCPHIVCPANDLVCQAAYNQPNDIATKSCVAGTELYLELCQAPQNVNMNYNSLLEISKPAVESKVKASPAAEAAPAAKPAHVAKAAPAAKAGHAHHSHKGIKHVHERIQRSRIFNRR